jgi:hypothetical protein
MIVNVLPYGDEYKVEIQQGSQHFTLEYYGPQKECEWMAHMFRIALKNHNNEVLKPIRILLNKYES